MDTATNNEKLDLTTENGAPDRGTLQKEARRPEFIPAVDLYESDEKFLLVADLPGVREEDIDVTVEKNILTITGKTGDVDTGDYRLAYSECRNGNYRRSFSLSEEVDRDNIRATYRDGVLRLEIARVKPMVRRIEIKPA